MASSTYAAERNEIIEVFHGYLEELPDSVIELFIEEKKHPNSELIPGYTLLNAKASAQFAKSCFKEYDERIKLAPVLSNHNGSYFIFSKMFDTETIILYWNDEYIDTKIHPDKFVEMLLKAKETNVFYEEDNCLNFNYEQLSALFCDK